MDRSCFVDGNFRGKFSWKRVDRAYRRSDTRSGKIGMEEANRSKISLPFLIFSIDVPFPPLFNDRVIARDENVTGGNCVKTENGERGA